MKKWLKILLPTIALCGVAAIFTPFLVSCSTPDYSIKYRIKRKLDIWDKYIMNNKNELQLFYGYSIYLVEEDGYISNTPYISDFYYETIDEMKQEIQKWFNNSKLNENEILVDNQLDML